MVFPRPIQAVIFDMDGLLIDSEVVYRDAIVGAAAAMGLELPPSVFKRMIGLPNAGSSLVLLEHFGEDLQLDRLLSDAHDRFHQLAEAGVALKAGVIELLDHLDELALPRAVCTSSTHDTVQHHLGGLGILPRFQAVIARGDYARGKPFPEPFLAAATALGIEPDHCLALEDSHNGIRAAHAAGMMTVMVPDLLDATDEMLGKCLLIADSLHHVLDVIRAHTPLPEGEGTIPSRRLGG